MKETEPTAIAENTIEQIIYLICGQKVMLDRDLAEMEKKYDEPFNVVFQALNALMASPEPERKKIGFSVHEQRARYRTGVKRIKRN